MHNADGPSFLNSVVMEFKSWQEIILYRIKTTLLPPSSFCLHGEIV